jgi:hypothetical protein
MSGPGIRPVDNGLVGGGSPDRAGQVPVEGPGNLFKGEQGKIVRPVCGREPGRYCFYYRVIDRGTFYRSLFVSGGGDRISLRLSPDIARVCKQFREPYVALFCIEDPAEGAVGDEMTVFCDGKEREPEQGTVHRKRDLGAPHPDIVPGDAPGELLTPRTEIVKEGGRFIGKGGGVRFFARICNRTPHDVVLGANGAIMLLGLMRRPSG